LSGKEEIKQRYGMSLGDGVYTWLSPREVVVLKQEGMKQRLVRFNLDSSKEEAEGTIASIGDADVSCLYAPEDNKALIILGCDDGHIEVRDTETLSKIAFSHTFTAGRITACEFHIDTYANLITLHENGAVNRLILSVEKRTGRMRALKD
jgi:hypothetical protein